MPSQLRCVQAILYWCYDKELYVSNQSTRSWAYGDEYFTLRFSLPSLPREISGLRLSIQPCPVSINIQSVSFSGAGVINKWQDVSIDSFGTLEARISPYPEPANMDIDKACATVKAHSSLFKALKRGGSLDIVLNLGFDNTTSVISGFTESVKSSSETNGKASPALTPAVARELREMHNEVMILAAVVQDFYRSNSWQWTMWCRNFSSVIRQSPLFRVYLLLSKTAQNIFNRPLKAVHYLTTNQIIDIVVPVHNGAKQVEYCLNSVFQSSLNIQYELIVIDDASSDEELIQFLNKLAAENKITLLRNEKNIDYTAAVNKGMQLHPNRDIVLLNSDTAVSDNWLDRLYRVAYFKKHIGTVTPFSNNASICSYPGQTAETDIPVGYDLSSIDGLFSNANNGNIVRIPTAVGFCMYIKRACLKQVGYFDSEIFPGYGEENDFCMRAHKLGWWHVLAADTFVYHEGGASYGDLQKKRKRIAYDFLVKMHPEFQELVNEFVRIDPILPYRRNIDYKRMRSNQRPLILLLLHGHAGGTEKHVLELAKFFGKEVDFLLLRVFGERAHVRWLNKGEGFWQDFQMPTAYDELRNFLKVLPIQSIHVHHFLGLESIIDDLIDDLNLPFDFTVHDFYTVCPRGWLCDYRQHYCGQPDEDACNACLAALPNPQTLKIQQWRKKYSWLIEKARRVFVPSQDTLMRLKHYLPVANYILAPHLDSNLINYPEPTANKIGADEPLRVVVLGLLNAEKGSDILDACAIDALERKLPLEFHFLGAAHRPLSGRPHGSMLIYGRYDDEKLQDLLQQVRPHLAWFPAQCPETYSYTLSACLQAGLPILAPDIGAFSERLSQREWSWIQSWQLKPEQWNDFLIKIMNDHFKSGSAPPLFETEKSAKHYSYVEEYLQPYLANHANKISNVLSIR